MWSSPEHRTERCAACATERTFEQPPGSETGRETSTQTGHDGHDTWSEWFCVDCGSALFLAQAAA
ncbi:hypothetical protein GCM10009555_036870 [Acrocarpospora macrocephala]|uniref:Uncharacterized protein n=1 Tax=Acrocarpospora macrocephala TaxID=150177 RepID=A0A5M3X516_9ACTN|nr:hypothetical protein [Acrocarpospora macrocephala]GES13248.1 hypothetical protein Amac_068450 [Acrocarpospora macrocephala]